MDIRQLQYFLLVVQYSSFSKAAQHAYVSQQAISKAIRAMEEEIGVPLFDRTTHGLQVTRYGQILLSCANDITLRLNDAINEIQHLHRQSTNYVRIGLANGLENFLPLDALLTSTDTHPKYRITTISDTDSKIEESLLSNRIDLGIIGNFGSYIDISYIPLYKSPAVLAVSLDNPLSTAKTVSILDLKDQKILTSSQDYKSAAKLMALCNLNGFTPRIQFTTVNLDYFIQLVEHNQGVFPCPCISSSAFQSRRVALVPFAEDPDLYHVHLLHRKSQENPAIRSIISLLIDSCRNLT